MARELRRLLIAPERFAAAAGADGVLVLEPAEAHYLGRVLRTRVGEQLAVVDGCGGLWTARLLEPSRLALEQPAGSPLERQPPPRPWLSLALAVPKREPELVWRMATELGVDQLQPLQAERCVAAGRWPLPRWRTIVGEAVEQCERLWLPPLADPVAAQPWLAAGPPDTAAGAGIAAVACAAGSGDAARQARDAGRQACETGRQTREPARQAGVAGSVGLLATTRRPDLPLLAALLRELPPASVQAIALAIGPEGGWSPTEEEAGLAAGWRPVSLGPLILRSSTAALAGLAELVSWRNLSCPSFPAPSP